MDRHLLDYLPPVLQKVLEFKAINEACEPEIVLAWDALTLILDNQFLDTAKESGVRVWEQELGIYPKDTDTLQARKDRIKAYWNRELPYTLPWLKQWLAGLCGPLGHQETVTDYTIAIQLDHTVLPDAARLTSEILELLLAVRPSNMRVLMDSMLQTNGGVIVGACSEMESRVDVWPRLVNDMESFGGSIAAGTIEYQAKVNIYPKQGGTQDAR